MRRRGADHSRAAERRPVQGVRSNRKLGIDLSPLREQNVAFLELRALEQLISSVGDMRKLLRHQPPILADGFDLNEVDSALRKATVLNAWSRPFRHPMRHTANR